MTDSFTLESSAHRVGGSDRYERTFISQSQMVYPNGVTSVVLQGLLFSNAMIRVELGRFCLVRPTLWSAEMMLSDVNAHPVGPPRPVFISTYPCDVPLYSSHIASDPDWGVYSVGLRVPRSYWTAEDVSQQEGTTDENSD